MTALSESTRRLALAATFVAILIATIYATEDRTHVVASVAGCAAAATLIAAAVISWERSVATAQSTGLVGSTRHREQESPVTGVRRSR